jgi:hypothetical protein
MLIREFAGDTQTLHDSPLLVKLVATLGQLKARIDDEQERDDWTVEELLDYLKDNEVIIDKHDLYDMIQEPPLSNTISNIQGDQVIFAGQDGEDELGGDDEEEKHDTVKDMAARAGNARKP